MMLPRPASKTTLAEMRSGLVGSLPDGRLGHAAYASRLRLASQAGGDQE